MYIRFQTSEMNMYSNRLSGLFFSVYEFRDGGTLTEYERDYLASLLIWFDDNLNKPTKFGRKKQTSDYNKGLARYKDTALEHINKMYELKIFLENHDWYIEVIKSKNPGYIVYEDEFQIVAEPFKDTL